MSTQSERTHAFEPDYASAPGEILAEVLGERGMSQADLARRTDLSTKHINQLIQGEAALSPETALKLERVTQVPARLWSNLEANYQQQLSSADEASALQDDIGWLQQLPVQELIKRGAIERRKEPVDQLRAVLNFFGVASRKAWQAIWDVPTAYRRSRAFESDLHALAAWLRIGELKAQHIDHEPFSRTGFKASLDEIRSLTRISDPAQWLPRLREICAASGVAVVIEKEIPGARINGAVRWLASDLVMIQLSVRHRWADILWFSFFHEAGHILLHERKRQTFIDANGSSDDELELEADAFASRSLIPREYDERLATLRSQAAIQAFAQEVGIGPGIVVGRLQHDRLVPFSKLNGLRTRLLFPDDSAS
jgi:addiction module HigA family antidote